MRRHPEFPEGVEPFVVGRSHSFATQGGVVRLDRASLLGRWPAQPANPEYAGYLVIFERNLVRGLPDGRTVTEVQCNFDFFEELSTWFNWLVGVRFVENIYHSEFLLVPEGADLVDQFREHNLAGSSHGVVEASIVEIFLPLISPQFAFPFHQSFFGYPVRAVSQAILNPSGEVSRGQSPSLELVNVSPVGSDFSGDYD